MVLQHIKTKAYINQKHRKADGMHIGPEILVMIYNFETSFCVHDSEQWN